MALIVDAVAVTALGYSLPQSWRNMCAGKSAIRAVEQFDTAEYACHVGASVDIPHRDRRRSRIFSLINYALDQLGPVPADTKVLTATTKAGIDNLPAHRA